MRRPGLALKLSVLLMLGVVGAMLVDYGLTSGSPLDRARVLVFVALSLGMALAAAVVVDVLVIRPLVRLSAQARRMEALDYAEPFLPTGMDEPRELGLALEHLRQRVVAEREDLRRLNAELEARVEERSAALAEAQRELLARERLVSVGRLAAGVAHEVNNPAGVILGRVGLILDDPAALPAELADDLRVVARQAERIREITSGLLRLGRPSRGERGPVDLEAVVRCAADLARLEAQRRGVSLAVEGASGPITGDAAALQQVVYNLIRNAVQASPDGAQVRMTVSAQQVVVEDRGAGLSPEAMVHLFEPFFTTKPLGEGTGLGLAVAHGIVRDHGGTLVAEARSGGGARFVVRLG
ncbi:MAG: two-component sensor histidine kinase [Myxococcales bacterium]|nr:two-component sensor histidine kinase [Myxococcales bacterium]